jgi:hypothetical protein
MAVQTRYQVLVVLVVGWGFTIADPGLCHGRFQTVVVMATIIFDKGGGKSQPEAQGLCTGRELESR